MWSAAAAPASINLGPDVPRRTSASSGLLRPHSLFCVMFSPSGLNIGRHYFHLFFLKFTHQHRTTATFSYAQPAVRPRHYYRAGLLPFTSEPGNDSLTEAESNGLSSQLKRGSEPKKGSEPKAGSEPNRGREGK